jgi:hypothetical protein
MGIEASCSDFVWPPPASTAEVFACDSGLLALPDPLAVSPIPVGSVPVDPVSVDSGPVLSGPAPGDPGPDATPRGEHSLLAWGPTPPSGSGLPPRVCPRETWRSLGRLAPVFVLVAVTESTYLGVHVVRAQRQLVLKPEVSVLPARLIAEPMTLLPTARAEHPSSNHGVASDRPMVSRAPRATEPARVGQPGWISIDLPIQIEIYEGGRFVGTNSTEHLAFTAGEHQLELVNESLQYRSTQVISVTPGKLVPVRVTLPSGTLNVNALPWGDVFIDGRPVGQTPLGNIKLPIGPHRIVFRHPELGEQTRTAVVGLGAPAHVTVDLRK